MQLEASQIDFRLTLELTPHEVKMLAYLSSLGGKAVKDFAGDKYNLDQWENLIHNLRRHTEAQMVRMKDAEDVWRGLKEAAPIPPRRDS